MTSKTDPIPDLVMEQAADWMYQLEAAPGDTSVEAGIRAWRRESDLHERAWALAQKTWRVSGHARPAFAQEWPDRAAHPAARPMAGPAGAPAPYRLGAVIRARPRRRLVAALGLVACLAIVFGLPGIQSKVVADYATATGETRDVRLDDGSTVQLAADTAITTRYSAMSRAITLLRGEAFFRVVADRQRPFVVGAGDLTVSVTGTAFDVGLTDRTISVTVASGSVRVVRASTANLVPFDLGPGQGLAVDRSSGKATESAPAAASVAAWRHGRLVVENQPMADAVEVIARYHRGFIVMPDSRLRESRVTGVYDLDDPVRALRALSASYGGVVREITPFLIVISTN